MKTLINQLSRYLNLLQPKELMKSPTDSHWGHSFHLRMACHQSGVALMCWLRNRMEDVSQIELYPPHDLRTVDSRVSIFDFDCERDELLNAISEAMSGSVTEQYLTPRMMEIDGEGGRAPQDRPQHESMPFSMAMTFGCKDAHGYVHFKGRGGEQLIKIIGYGPQGVEESDLEQLLREAFSNLRQLQHRYEKQLKALARLLLQEKRVDKTDLRALFWYGQRATATAGK
ncbi:MAG: hypothetical protein AAFO94_14485 [Bacteroidota bacterium]